MEEKKLVPEIRFKGYDDEWESLPFSKIVNRSSSISFDETIPSVEYEDILSGEGRLNKDINQKTIHKSGQRFSKGDILFGKLRPYLRNNLLSDFEGIAVGDFWIFKEGLAKTDFVYPFIYSHDFDFISNISSGSKMPRSDWQLISTWNFNIPLNSNEQQEIGNYFKKLDGLIADTEKEIKRLEKLKTASLQKMFPQPGESVPQIRFKGFTEPWEEIKLEDRVTFSRGIGYSKSDLKEQGHQIFLYGRLYTDYSTYIEEVDTYSHLTSQAILSKGSEVVLPSSGETAEDIAVASAILKPNIILAGGLNILYPDSEIDSIFLALLLTYGPTHTILSKKAQGKSVVHIYNQDIADLNVLVPSIEEQKAIGEYFRNLDNLIKEKKKKVSQLRNLKKASLSKMFVNTVKQ